MVALGPDSRPRTDPSTLLENALFHISPEFLENSKIRTKGGTKTEEVKATKKDKAIILYSLQTPDEGDGAGTCGRPVCAEGWFIGHWWWGDPGAPPHGRAQAEAMSGALPGLPATDDQLEEPLGGLVTDLVPRAGRVRVQASHKSVFVHGPSCLKGLPSSVYLDFTSLNLGIIPT
ncbi:hypothetical protein E5288_WYG012088 [Bos mutus]|uniref:Uncharacterized protein n=1 Tax=Bos mutus TaxID=72004 RepID=A0A6B0R8I1_9CETA|nr:hypothetical protein [Bos mutus]